MAKQSAGILIYRHRNSGVEVFLVHPGGPFWRNKDLGSWSIPKGEFVEGEHPLEVAQRELREETGLTVDGSFVPLAHVRQRGGKVVHAYAIEVDVECGEVKSNTFTIEWPPRSGKMQEFPEVDRAEWFALDEARTRILASQLPLVDELRGMLGA